MKLRLQIKSASTSATWSATARASGRPTAAAAEATMPRPLSILWCFPEWLWSASKRTAARRPIIFNCNRETSSKVSNIRRSGKEEFRSDFCCVVSILTSHRIDRLRISGRLAEGRQRLLSAKLRPGSSIAPSSGRGCCPATPQSSGQNALLFTGHYADSQSANLQLAVFASAAGQIGRISHRRTPGIEHPALRNHSAHEIHASAFHSSAIWFKVEAKTLNLSVLKSEINLKLFLPAQIRRTAHCDPPQRSTRIRIRPARG